MKKEIFPSRLPDLAAERVENPLLVGAPERRDKQPLGAISSEPVDDRLRRKQLQAVNNQITIRIQCKQRERIGLVFAGQFGPF